MHLKPALRRTWRFTRITLLSVLAFLVLYVLAALGLSRICCGQSNASTEEIPIYILTNGVHTDIVVPAQHELMDWTQEIRFENTRGRDTTYTYLSLGWGDKGFYLETPTWADLKFRRAFKAATGLGSAAIHATYYSKMEESDRCRRMTITREEYAQLIGFIRASFTVSEEEHFMHIRTTANYGNSDAFYDAVGSYHLFHTCNTWANNALKSCGQKAALWTVSDIGIFCHYE